MGSLDSEVCSFDLRKKNHYDVLEIGNDSYKAVPILMGMPNKVVDVTLLQVT